MAQKLDAIVVGAGPNGLSAAIMLAARGKRVHVVEANPDIGGGARTAELTLPGFRHDICSAIHSFGRASPFLRALPLARFGLEWIDPRIALAHPQDDGSAAVLMRPLDETAAAMGEDGPAYHALMQPIVARWEDLVLEILGPLRIPRHPFLMARFGLHGVRSCVGLVDGLFRTRNARALMTGMAAHSTLPLDSLGTGAVALVLGASGHVANWPVAAGGSQRVADALAEHFRSLGGTIETGTRVQDVRDLPSSHRVLLNVTPRQVLKMARHALPDGYARALERFRYGAGVFKMDWALDGPVPWTAKECREAVTVHVGGTMEEIVECEARVNRGEHPDRPFVIVAQQSLLDGSRAPRGHHTLWGYCHVPHASTEDMTSRIEAQIERFAPGFRQRIIARHVMFPADMEAHNNNYVGGDINGGAEDIRQIFTRPVVRLTPYSTPDPRILLCSSSTPPGGGVHGLCGFHAARAALQGWDD